MGTKLVRLTFFGFVLCGVAVSGLAQSQPVHLREDVSLPFHFISAGDTRFTDPTNTDASNPGIRLALVKAIANAHPAFVTIGGDITYNGNDVNDWLTWDKETTVWRDQGITVHPAIGNHEMHGDLNISLANYFKRFPELNGNLYYTVRAANLLLIVLDSSIDENTGPQHDWLIQELDRIPAGVDFVVLILHHPPVTSSHDNSPLGGGHSARPSEQALGAMLEEKQQHVRARFVVIASHVHNYERHEQGGITYFVTGGGGAHAYPIERDPNDPYPDNRINYNYLDSVVDSTTMKVTMNRVELRDGRAIWTQPDSVTIPAKGVTARPVPK